MRSKRRLLISAGAVAGALLLAVGAAFIPQVQTWAARKAISSMAGQGASLKRMSVGLSRMSLEGLRVQMGGAVLVVPSAEAELGVVSAALGRGIHVRRLVAKGWTLDLANSRQPGAPGAARGAHRSGPSRAARALAGMLAAFNVPADLSVDGVDLEGRVIIPDDDGRPMGNARIDIVGGGLAAGRDGRFLCGASASLNDATAPVSAVAVRGTLFTSLDESGRFTRADLRVGAKASGRQFPSGIGLACEASAARKASGNSYSLSLSRGAERIASIDAVNPDGSRRLSGAWRLDLRDTDLAPFALGRSLPVFDAAGQGSYAVDLATRDVHALGRIRGSADRLGVVADGLAALGRVNLAADFDLARVGASLRVDRLETSISAAVPVASVRALQAFEFNLASGELKVASPAGDLVGISVEGVPLSWLMGAMPGFIPGGGDAQGEFVIRAEEGRLALRTKAPLTATGVSLSREGRQIAAGLEVSAFVLADYAPQGWQVQLAPFEVRSEGIKVLSLEARLGRLAGADQAVKAAGSWSASLPALLSQPGAADLPRLSGGDAKGSFEASLGSTRELLVKVALNSLEVGPGSPVALPSITSDIRADFEMNGHTAFNVPLHFDYGTRTADMIFSGTLSSDRDGPRIDAALSGAQISTDDLAVIGALSGSSAVVAGPAEPPGAAPTARSPAASPFWPGIRGRLSVRLKDLALPRIDLRDLRGEIVMERDSLRVESGTASVGDGSAARLDGELKFTPGAGQPYSFWTSLAVDNVDSGPLFRAMDPDKPPAIEGRFDLSSHLSGVGDGFGDLFDRAQGDCKLSSKDGRCRILRTDVTESIKQAPSKLADALGTVTSLFGKKLDKVGEALVESATGLSEIHYDQMNISAVRGSDLSILITEFVLIAPEERFTGTGKITYEEGVPIAAQPLSIDIDVGVRGRLAKFLAIVGLLREGQDELGYTRLYQPVHLGGTLQKVDQSQWREMLIQAPLRKGGSLINKLLGR
jgi:hypothetical protein